MTPPENALKRIAFVDDEPLVLDGLRRVLRPQRHEWEMEFFENGPALLQRMEVAPFDVVVSDMRMPGMDGVRVMAEVMRMQPMAVRVILSGHADRELMLQCVGTVHQYLSKPCDPAALQAVIRRATAVGFLPRQERLRALVGQMRHLPAVPALYSELVAALNEPDAELSEIGELVRQDMGTTARLLKLVNSPYFGLRAPLAQPVDAIHHLGLEMVKSLVLAAGAYEQLDGWAPPSSQLESIWAHGMAVASGARIVAQVEGLDPRRQDEAYVGGLLHDIGKMVLEVNLMPQELRMLQRVRERSAHDREAELEVFGADHADVGGFLLALWGLPAAVVEAVALHHRPLQGTGRDFSPLSAVHVANALVHWQPGRPDMTADHWLDLDYLQVLGRSDRRPKWAAAWQAEFARPAGVAMP